MQLSAIDGHFADSFQPVDRSRANLFVPADAFLQSIRRRLDSAGQPGCLHHQIFRKLSFHAGYTRTQARSAEPTAGPSRCNPLDFGLDYGDALTFQLTRRTTLSFGASLGSARAVPGCERNIESSATRISRTRWVGRGSQASCCPHVWDSSRRFREPVLDRFCHRHISADNWRRASSWVSTPVWTRGYIGLDQSRHYDATAARSALSIGAHPPHRGICAVLLLTETDCRQAHRRFALTNFDRQTASVGLSLFATDFQYAEDPLIPGKVHARTHPANRMAAQVVDRSAGHRDRGWRRRSGRDR